MRRSLRALAALLAYPTAELQQALPEIRAALAHEPELAPALPGLAALAESLGGDLLDAQEAHVALFDRGRGFCLNLFEHVHGDSRERGPAMVELNEIYEAAGLQPATGELPDYLPLMLEYAAVAPATGAELLANAAPVLDLLHGRLAARGSAYAAVLHGALLVAGRAPAMAIVAPEPEQSAAELDAAWAEAPVVFGPGADPAGECGGDALIARLRAGRRNPAAHRPPVVRHLATQG